MKIRCLLLALLITQTASIFAQSRSDVRIFIPIVTAEDPTQADFFRRNFMMEISAAGYTVTESVQDADYTMRMSVRRSSGMNADGTPQPPPPGERQYMLQITLMRNSDTVQIVTLSYGFDELEEMYNHNLSLAYQVLANVPLGSGDGQTLVKYMVGRDDERGDWWRNKWLYFRISADYPISYYQIKSNGLYDNAFIFNGASTANPGLYSRISPQIVAMPGMTAGLELQFLDWMSLEANFELRLWDVVGFTYMPGFGAQLKFPIKSSTHWMIEPYGAGVMAMNLAEHSILFPRYSVGGGIQFGVKSGSAGVLFFDANYMHSLDEVITLNLDDRFKKPAILHWNRFVIGLSVGLKIGVINRGGSGKRAGNTTWLFKNS